jgi:ankyrin repeat protein
MGNLAEVETAITAKADLNAFVYFTEEDELTLLQLAVLNEHHDPVQRLLQIGEVQANRPSGSKGRTALFLAAELGRFHALVLLLEHSADLNQLADDGQV